MSTQLATLTPTDEVIQSLSEKGITETLIQELAKSKHLTVDAKIDNGQVVYNADQLKAVSEARKKIKNTRVLIEKTCKSFRDVHTAINKENSAKEKEFVSVLSPVETFLLEEENKVEALKQQLRDEEEKQQHNTFCARVIELEGLGMQSKEFGQSYVLNDLKVSSVDLKFIPESGYLAFLNEVKAEHQKEVDRLAQIEAEKKEAEEILRKQKEEQQQEALRLEGIRREQEAKEKQIAEAAAKLEAEKKAIEDAKRKEEEAKQREIELKKIREEEAEKARVAADEKAKADELARIEAKKRAAEKEARRIARMPDKKKLIEYSQLLLNIPSPELKSTESAAILADAEKQIGEVFEKLIKQIETL